MSLTAKTLLFMILIEEKSFSLAHTIPSKCLNLVQVKMHHLILCSMPLPYACHTWDIFDIESLLEFRISIKDL